MLKKLLIFILVFSLSVFADNVDDGRDYIYSLQNSDGSWGDNSLNKFVYTSEVLNTLQVLNEKGVNYVNGLEWLQSQFPENVDFLSKKLSIYSKESINTKELINKIISCQNGDGGFGITKEYESNLLHTIVALDGLSCVFDTNSNIIKGINYLIINQNSDGGYSFIKNRESSVFTTSLALSLFYKYTELSEVNNAIEKGVSYLVSQMNPDSGFGETESSIYETAFVLQALIKVNKRSDVCEILKNYLMDRQLANGSWNNNVYETALALRSFHFTTLPDLVVNSVSFEPEVINEGDTAKIISSVMNIGEGTAQNIDIRLYEDGVSVGDTIYNEIASGDTVDIEIPWNTFEKTGYHTIGVRIDPVNLIEELSKSNNYLERMIYVQDTVPPESLDIYVQNPYFSPNGDGIKDISSVYFTAFENVTVDVNVTDKNGEMVRNLATDEFYSPGTYSLEWDGTNDTLSLLDDGDYVYNIFLEDRGGNIERRHHFVVIDRNKTPIFESLDPNRIYTERVMVDEDNSIELLDYFPEQDYCFFSFQNKLNEERRDLVFSNGLRTYLYKLFEVDGIRDFQYSDPYHKIFFKTGYYSPLLCFDLREGKLDTIVNAEVTTYQISPENDEILYHAIYQSGSGYYEGLSLTDFDASYHKFVDSNAYNTWWMVPDCWSPDGNLFFYYKWDDDGSAVFLFDPTSDKKEEIFKAPGMGHITWSPDGKKLVINYFKQPSHHEGLMGVGVLDISTKQFKNFLDFELNHIEWFPFPCVWNKKGDAFLVTYMNDVSSDGLYEIDLVQDTVKRLIDINKENIYLSYLPQYVHNDSLILLNPYRELYCMARNGENRTLISKLPSWGDIRLSKDETFFLNGEEYVGLNADNLTAKINLQRLINTPNQLTISGAVSDKNLEYYTLSYGEGENPSVYNQFYLSSNCVYDTVIATWIPPETGSYTIKLQAFDKAGNFLESKKSLYWRWDELLVGLNAKPDIFDPLGADSIVSSTEISYYIRYAEPLTFNIFYGDTLKFSKQMNHPVAGEYSFTWDGRDSYGKVVKDGEYSIKSYGYSVPVKVDANPPVIVPFDFSFHKQHFIMTDEVRFTLNCSADDEHFKSYTVYLAYEDSSNFLPIITRSSSIPYYSRTGDLYDLGMYYSKVSALDYLLHRRDSIKSCLVDSFYVCGEVGTRDTVYYIDGRRVEGKIITDFKSIARPRLPEVDSVVFSIGFVKGNSIIGYFRQGKGTKEPEGYYIDTNWVQSYSCKGVKFKGEVWYNNGGYRVAYDAVSLEGIVEAPPPRSSEEDLFFVRPHEPPTCERAPKKPPVISGIYDIEANYIKWINCVPYDQPELVEYVNFEYSPVGDTISYSIGLKVDSFPFSQPWNTYLVPNSYYILTAKGFSPLYDALQTSIRVQVINNPIVLNLGNKNGEYSASLDSIYAKILVDTNIAGNIQSVMFYYELDGDSILITEDEEFPYECAFETTLLPDTNVRFFAYTSDDEGNKAWSNSVNIIIDNTPPIAEIVYPTDGMSFDNPDFIDILGNVYDKNIDSVKVMLDDSKVKFSNSNLTDTLALLDARTLESGNYEISVVAKDRAGNVNSDNVLIEIINSPRPAVSIEKPDNNSLHNDTTQIVYSVTDDNLSYYVLKYGKGSDPTDYTVIDSTNSVGKSKKYILNTVILQDTLYSIVLYAKDLTDNENADTVFFNVDNTSPEVFITYPNEYEKFKLKFPVIGNVMDKNLLQDTLFVGMGEMPSLWTALVTGNKNFENDTILIWDPFKGSDIYTFRLLAVDFAGNKSEDSVTIYLDTVPPAPPEGLTAVDSFGIVDLSWEPNTEDDLEGYYLFRQGMKLNTRAFLNISYVDTLPSIEGKYSYYLTAVDELGNESKTSDTVSIEVDLSPPYVKIISPENNQWINGIDTVMGTITDKNFLEYNLEYSPAADTVYSFLVTGLSEIPFGEIYKWDVSGFEGSFNLRLRGMDTYDNSDTSEIVVRVDNTPPLMPDSLIATSNGSRVNLSWLKATDDHLAGYYLYRDGEEVKTSIITDTFSVDTVFDGEYSYMVIAADSAGNLSTPAGPKSAIVDTRAPSVVISNPEEGSEVNGMIDILTECQDNDLLSVLFRCKEETGTWKDIREVSSAPFTTQFNADSLTYGKYYLSAIGNDVHNNTDNSPDSIFIFKFKQEDLSPPAAPRGLVYEAEPISGNKGEVTLYWKENTEDDLELYNVYRDGSLVASVMDTMFTEELDDNSYYKYNISAIDTASNESDLSDPLIADFVPPELIIHNPIQKKIYNGVIPINITVKDKNLSYYSLLGGSISDTTPHILYEGSVEVSNETVYRWNTKNFGDIDTLGLVLLGSDINGFSDTTGVMFLIDNLPPPPPESLDAACMSEFVPPPIEVDSIAAFWLPVTTEPVAYNIYYSTVSGTGYVKLNDQLVFDNWYITALPGGKTYYFVVTAEDELGNESDYSNEASASPLPCDIDIVVSDNDIWNFPSSPLVGDSVLTVVKVHNKGKFSADNFSLKLMLEREGKYITLKDWLVSSLSPDSVGEFSVKWSSDGLAGQNTLYLLADPEDFVKETDESNNWYTYPIEIREADVLFTCYLSDSLIPPFTDLTAYYSIINTGAEEKDLNLTLSIINLDSTVISKDFDLEHIIYDSMLYSSYGSFFYDTTNSRFGEISITDSVGAGITSFGFSSDSLITELADSQYIIQYVYLDTLNPPSEIMLQFEDKYGGKDHRAFWGSDLINKGISGTSSRKKFGSLPEKGKWVRLTVPLEQVGIYDGGIKGMEFLHYGGRLCWDGTGIGGNSISITLAQAEEENIDVIWNSLNYHAGEHRIKSVLNDGSKTVEREMPFTIESTGGVESYVNTDKPNYNTLENVYITTRIVNNSPNQTYLNLKEFIIIVDSGDYEHFTDSASISNLLPGEENEHQFVFSTGYSSPGMYEVKEYLLSGTDTLSNSTGQFYINPSSGEDIRISGNISAVPKIIPYPDSFTVFYSLRNSGNIPVDLLPISIKLHQVEEGITINKVEDTISLGIDDTLEADFRISSESLGLKPYALQLYVHPRDTTMLLSVAGFIIKDFTPPLVEIKSPSGLVGGLVGVSSEVSDFESGINSVYFEVDSIIRVMSRVSGDSLEGVYESVFDSKLLKDSSYVLTVTALDYFGNLFTDSSLIEVRNDLVVPSCSVKIKPIPRVLSITDDTLFVKSVLEPMDIYYKVVRKEYDFEKEIRSGIYNIYLVSGDHICIDPLTQREINEVVFAGEGLITLTSSPHLVMPRLWKPFGVCVLGRLPGWGYNINFDESDISHRDTLSSGGKALRMYLWGGKEIAEFEKMSKEKGCGSVSLKAQYPFYSENKSRIIIKAMKGEDKENNCIADTFDIDSIPVLYMDEKITDEMGNIRIDSVTERSVTFSFDVEEEFNESYNFQIEILGEREVKKIDPVSIPLKDIDDINKSMNFGGFEVCKVEPLCCHGHDCHRYPAVVQNTYGEGKTYLFGFDPSDVSEKEDLKEKIRNAVLASVPDTEKVYIYKVISPTVTVIPPQLIEDIDIKELIPEEFEAIAVLDSGEVKDYGFNWIKNIADTSEFRSVVRVPGEPFTDSILITINNADSLKILLEGEKEISGIINDVIDSLEALNLNRWERHQRDVAVKMLEKALKNEIKKKKDLIRNIGFGVTAGGFLSWIKSVDCSEERKEINKAVRIWEAMWYKWK